MTTYATDLETLESVCEVEFIRASGPGGQHRNKRETGIRLKHPEAQIVVLATERRSQARNRALAFERMIARLEALNYTPPTRHDTRPSRASVKRRVEAKKQKSQRKKLRGKVRHWD